MPPDSALDRAAAERGTSVYLPGTVLPMLPERLCNNLCSLRPGEDHYAKSVFITYDKSGKALETTLARSVICSRRRFTYDEALAILNHDRGEGATSDLPPDHEEYADVLRQMARLRDRLEARRRSRGALYLDIPSLRLELDESCQTVGLRQEQRDPSHSLIEEFMLEANEAVARYCLEKGLPVVGRVHPAPEEEKLEDLRVLLQALDIQFGTRGGSKALQKIVEQVVGGPLATLVQLSLLKTMGHAEYVCGAGLHYALAAKAYCHFTSPIRRYPDLLVHQVIEEHLKQGGGKLSAKRVNEWNVRMSREALRSSDAERRAENAERALLRLRLIRFLEPSVGQTMEASLVSIHEFGFFVRVEETLVEGLVHVSTLGDDYYDFEPERMQLVGRRRRKMFRLGDRVRVELADVDADMREISFRFVKRLTNPERA